MRSPTEITDEFVKNERQWKRHVRVKFARHMKKISNVPEVWDWDAVLQRYGVRADGSALPSTSEMLERSLVNDERKARAKIALAEVPEG